MTAPKQGAHSKFHSWAYSALKDVYAQMRARARLYGHSWRIPLAVFSAIIQKPCFYCGASPKGRYWSRHARRYFYYSGLDRVVNRYGYFVGNVVPCCEKCNRMKGEHLTAPEMLAAIRAIKKLRKK